MLLKLIPGDIKPNLQRQFKIFSNKHTWVMSIIYTMTFGSFIGYSAGFALAIKVVFGFQHVMVDGVMTHTTANPNGPSALMYAWMGPFIGALIRPVGGWISDKVGGAKVTQIVSIVMIGSALGVAYFLKQAYVSATPEEFFLPFFLLFLILFAATGIGNGSTFPHHRHGVRQGAGRTCPGLDLGRGRLRRLHHPQGVRRADQAGDPGVRALRFRHLLLRLPAAELVVLPGAEGGNQESVTAVLERVRAFSPRCDTHGLTRRTRSLYQRTVQIRAEEIHHESLA